MPRVRREFIDADYLSQLSEKELKWYNKFIGEYYSANLDFKNLRKNIHKTKKLKKECTDRNNKQNNDLFGVARSNGLMSDLYQTQEEWLINNPDLAENAIITEIDKKKLK